MVRDGIYYALAFIMVALIVGYFTVWPLAILPLLLAAFFAWFFRDPDRIIPQGAGLIVSPGDGKVTDIVTVDVKGEPWTRISIFLNVFNVHVNRSPIAGTIREVRYQKGNFGNAMGAISAEANEQNVVTVEGEGQTVIFKQIAGLLARRIVFSKKVGDVLARGERVGLIKFGSRVDVIFTSDSEVSVKIGDHVAGGSTVLAVARVEGVASPVISGSERGGVR
jgi:phosphatidylserine decarboxylase